MFKDSIICNLSTLFAQINQQHQPDGKELQTAKFLIQELRKDPFHKDFNLASFDSMTRDEILQIFNDVLAHLDHNQQVQISHEDLQETVGRILEFLRVLKYKPCIEDPIKYRDAVQNGDTRVILPVMAWILERKELLKTRAYLAHFLVEIEIPPECLEDEEISETRQKYLTLLEEFKYVHKQYEKTKIGQNTGGLVSDMQNIEHDLECIRRRIEMARSKYMGYPDLPNVLKQARLTRKGRDKAHELCKQAHIEEQKLREAEEKIRFNRRILKDLREKSGGRTAEGIVEALEENCEVLNYIIQEKIPNEIDANERCITAMKLVENDPPNSQQDINDLKMKTQLVKTELHALESRIIRKLHDGDLQQLREQVLQVNKIHQLKSTKLACLNRDVYIQKKLLEQRSIERSMRSKGIVDANGFDQHHLQAETDLTDEQYAAFMKQMRVKVTKYKQMRSDLARLQNEAGILASTKFILGGELKETADNLAAVENQLGIPGFTETQEKLETLSAEKATLDESKRMNLHEMSCMSKELHDKISLKKLYMEPIMKELQAKRLSTQLLEADFNKLKDQYQSSLMAAELDTCHYKAKIEQLICEEKKFEMEYCKFLTEIGIMKTNLQRASDELQFEGLYMVKEKSRGFKDKLLTKILEEERKTKALKEESETIDDICAQRRTRAELWDHLRKFMKLKMDVRSRQ